MGTEHAARGALPGCQCEGPEIRRLFPMTRVPRRAHRLLALALMLGLLAVVSPASESVAWAKPYTESDPTTSSGDPTGDDQPDPTPKSKSPSASLSVRGGSAVRSERPTMVRVIGSWQMFARYLRMFPLR